DVDGNAATHTGPGCFDWAGGVPAQDVAIQGNILTGPEFVEAMRTAWDSGRELPFARRLLAALMAGDEAGGDRRGRQSAALLVVREEAGYGGLDDVAVDLRVDDHPDPCAELSRLLELNRIYLTASTDEEKVTLDDVLRAELEALARATGQPDLAAWVGSENYEMRVDLDATPGWVDRLVVGALGPLLGVGGLVGQRVDLVLELGDLPAGLVELLGGLQGARLDGLDPLARLADLLLRRVGGGHR